MASMDDRAAVLRRRALFLGSTLAALGSCQKSGAPPPAAQGPVVAVPEGRAEDAGGTEPEGGSLPGREGGQRPRDGMPTLDVPEGVSDTARRRYEDLARVMTRAHSLLDDIEAALPRCGIADCEDQWAGVARKLFELEDSQRFFFACGGTSEEAKAFARRHKEHTDFYNARYQEMEGRLRAMLGDAGRNRLQELLAEERRAHPRPCLSIRCVDW